MTNEEKRDLMNFVKRRINGGYNCRETVKALQKIGFKEGTIRMYYKVALSSDFQSPSGVEEERDAKNEM